MFKILLRGFFHKLGSGDTQETSEELEDCWCNSVLSIHWMNFLPNIFPLLVVFLQVASICGEWWMLYCKNLINIKLQSRSLFCGPWNNWILCLMQGNAASRYQIIWKNTTNCRLYCFPVLYLFAQWHSPYLTPPGFWSFLLLKLTSVYPLFLVQISLTHPLWKLILKESVPLLLSGLNIRSTSVASKSRN